MEKLFEKHKDWLRIVLKFGCRKDVAEDIVQDMYLKIGEYLNKKVIDIMYNEEELNYYYIYLTLKSLYFNYSKRESKRVLHNFNECDTYSNELINEDYVNNFEVAEKVIEEELSKLHWYDKKVWDMYQHTNLAELSRNTGIGYRSLYNTKCNVEERLKDKLNGIR